MFQNFRLVSLLALIWRGCGWCGAFCNLQEAAKTQTIPYPPSANGQVERYYQLVLNYLRCYLGGKSNVVGQVPPSTRDGSMGYCQWVHWIHSQHASAWLGSCYAHRHMACRKHQGRSQVNRCHYEEAAGSPARCTLWCKEEPGSGTGNNETGLLCKGPYDIFWGGGFSVLAVVSCVQLTWDPAWWWRWSHPTYIVWRTGSRSWCCIMTSLSCCRTEKSQCGSVAGGMYCLKYLTSVLCLSQFRIQVFLRMVCWMSCHFMMGCQPRNFLMSQG